MRVRRVVFPSVAFFGAAFAPFPPAAFPGAVPVAAAVAEAFAVFAVFVVFFPVDVLFAAVGSAAGSSAVADFFVVRGDNATP
ncbi:hypothetical protein [Nocardiopsis sp. MG754419]|uniref:hypothetical protein n=1 Tax=Nocardiopsis sp. MG754419 TaxID=2259865 RepID=UPI001BAB63B7|nr:hypothetical protein [Nocardiopsis sp. MG754419]MBR8742343.1 hypothetical protein [Nocardiopsis sp. MG754419]